MEWFAELLFKNNGFRRTIQQFRQHRESAGNELDSDATIRATINNGGFFSPAYRSRMVLPEYLVLIDRIGYDDQQAKFIDEIINRFTRNGVFVDRYYFNHDPRICSPEKAGKNQIRLQQLVNQHPNHRLLVFSDGSGFIDPLTAKPHAWLDTLLQWTACAIFIPENTQDIRYLKHVLNERGFTVEPAGLHGLKRYIDVLQLQAGFSEQRWDYHRPYPELFDDKRDIWMQNTEPEQADIDALLAAMREYLDEEEFRIACACAVYPELHWELTLYLTTKLAKRHKETLEERAQDTFGKRLLNLTRLPWFRYGRMPDWLRLRLISQLVKDNQHHYIRKIIRQLLQSAKKQSGNSDERPEGSLRLPIAWKRLFFHFKYLKNKIVSIFRKNPNDSILNDNVFVNFLSGGKRNLLSVLIPDSVKRIFFRNGQAIFGLRPVVSLLAAIVLSGLVFLFLRWQQPAPEVTDIIPKFDFTPDVSLDGYEGPAGVGRESLEACLERFRIATIKISPEVALLAKVKNLEENSAFAGIKIDLDSNYKKTVAENLFYRKYLVSKSDSSGNITTNSIRSLYLDPDTNGILWIGTYGGGLFKNKIFNKSYNYDSGNAISSLMPLYLAWLTDTLSRMAGLDTAEFSFYDNISYYKKKDTVYLNERLFLINNRKKIQSSGYDLVLEQSVEKQNVKPGEKIEFNISVFNHGPGKSEKCGILIALPDGLTADNGARMRRIEIDSVLNKGDTFRVQFDAIVEKTATGILTVQSSIDRIAGKLNDAELSNNTVNTSIKVFGVNVPKSNCDFSLSQRRLNAGQIFYKSKIDSLKLELECKEQCSDRNTPDRIFIETSLPDGIVYANSDVRPALITDSSISWELAVNGSTNDPITTIHFTVKVNAATTGSFIIQSRAQVTGGSPAELTAYDTVVVKDKPAPEPKRIIVSASGDGDFKTIAEAVRKAQAGDEVFIRNGTYYEENISLKADNVSITGESRKVTVMGKKGVPLFNAADGSKFSTLTLLNTDKTRGYENTGIWLENVQNVEIINCSFKNGNCGISISSFNTKPTSVEIKSNIIEHFSYVGIHLDNVEVNISNNVLLNGNESRAAIEISDCKGNIFNNTIINSGVGIYTDIESVQPVNIYNNIISNNNYGIETYKGTFNIFNNILWNNQHNFRDQKTDKKFQIKENLFVDPQFTGLEKNDFSLRPGSPAIKAGVGSVDIGAVPYTNSSSSANVAGTLHLEGTVIADKQEVYGTWTKANSPYFVQKEAIVPEDKTLRIEPGVVVKFKTGENTDYTDSSFNVGFLRVNGILKAVGSGNDPVVFTRDGDNGHWGAIGFVDTKSNENIINYCRIEYGNRVKHFKADKVNINRQSLWHAISALNSFLVIDNSIIENDPYGGLYCDSSEINVETTFINNCDKICEFDGMSIANINNCIFTNNNFGIRGYNSSEITISNSIIFQNNEGILCQQTARIKIGNTIIWNNKNAFFHTGDNISNLSVKYSLLQGNKLPNNITDSGYNLFDSDPQFVNPEHGYFNLKSTSPCIGAGENGVDIGAVPFKK